MNKKNIGSSFDDFLKEDGIYEDVTEQAKKITQCPSCGNNAIKEVRNVEHSWKGVSFKYDQMGTWCETCNEGYLSPEDLKMSRPERDMKKKEIDEKQGG